MKPLFAVLLFLLILYPYAVRAEGAKVDVPSELIGVWGDEEMCLAYHRGDFFYNLSENGRLALKQGDNIEWECTFSNLETIYRTGQITGLCDQESVTIKPNNEDKKWHMQSDSLFLTKCAMSDMILGIGKDTKDIGGDFGFARHAGFTVGYGTAAASYCGYPVNEDVAQYTLVIGAEAAEKHAYANRLLPPEVWAQKLIEERSQLGIDAFHKDKDAIPDICSWIAKAYGEGGWVVDGLIKVSPADD